MAWDNSDRRSELPKDWPRRRSFVLLRDEYRCTERDQYDRRCSRFATDVDHIQPGANHDPANLRSVCRHHHNQKSSQEGNAARRRFTKKHPKEKHPGMR